MTNQNTIITLSAVIITIAQLVSSRPCTDLVPYTPPASQPPDFRKDSVSPTPNFQPLNSQQNSVPPTSVSQQSNGQKGSDAQPADSQNDLNSLSLLFPAEVAKQIRDLLGSFQDTPQSDSQNDATLSTPVPQTSDSQNNLTSTPVPQPSDNQNNLTSTSVSQPSDSQNYLTSTPVSQPSDNQINFTSSTPFPQPSDGQNDSTLSGPVLQQFSNQQELEAFHYNQWINYVQGSEVNFEVQFDSHFDGLTDEHLHLLCSTVSVMFNLTIINHKKLETRKVTYESYNYKDKTLKIQTITCQCTKRGKNGDEEFDFYMGDSLYDEKSAFIYFETDTQQLKPAAHVTGLPLMC